MKTVTASRVASWLRLTVRVWIAALCSTAQIMFKNNRRLRKVDNRLKPMQTTCRNYCRTSSNKLPKSSSNSKRNRLLLQLLRARWNPKANKIHNWTIHRIWINKYKLWCHKVKLVAKASNKRPTTKSWCSRYSMGSSTPQRFLEKKASLKVVTRLRCLVILHL